MGIVVGLGLVAALAVSSGRSNPVAGQEELAAPPGETATADVDPEAIHVEADYSQEWSTDTTDHALLRGNVVVRQGETTIRARQAVMWREVVRSGGTLREFLAVYLEDDVVLDRVGESRSGPSLYLELVTTAGITHRIRRRLPDVDGSGDPLFARATNRRGVSRRERILPTQLLAPGAVLPPPTPVVDQKPRIIRRVRIFPRSTVPYSVESFLSDTTPPEQIWLLTGGVNVILDGDPRYGIVDLKADRIVIWTEATQDGEFRATSVQSGDAPFQVYLEGNILIRQQEREIRAARAFYDARDNRGMMLGAELRTPLEGALGTLRIRATRIRQHGDQLFHAEEAWATTSEFGKPGYRVQSSDIWLEKRYVRPWVGATTRDGRPIVEEINWLTAENNAVYIDDLPVFYNGRTSAPAEDPNIPLRTASVGYNRIFGGRLETVWNMFKLTGVEEPEDVRWDLLADFRSERGIGLGTGGAYQGTGGFAGMPGRYHGNGLVYGMTDGGTDNLGGFRNDVEFESSTRGRLQYQHRQDLPTGTTIFGELGFLSDRDVLEQYWETEFDNGKDVDTLLYARHLYENWGVTGLGQFRVNDFETTTEWLPRFDVYGLSEPLFGGHVTWSNHSYAGLAHLRPGERPFDPLVDRFFTPLTDPFPGPASPNGITADAQGAVLMTRQQLDAPLHLGPVNVTPYVMGEATHWDEGFDDSGIDRLVGTAGVRASVLLWRVYPHVRSRLFNLNGLAHKMRFEAGYHLTEATESLADIPQYNSIDENSEERFRQLFISQTFNYAFPETLEPRYYALRSGAGMPVTSPYHEIVDDQEVLRLAWRNRWQTKVGPPDRLRVRDWMTFDLEGSYFPQAERDNFGEEIGLVNGRYEWHFSDRTRLVSNAQFDLFDNAPSVRNIALVSQRGERGSVYLGYRQFEFGNFTSDYAIASYSYRMSPKWVSTLGTSVDLAEGKSSGTSLSVTRIGRDFVTHMGFSFVESKDDVGFVFLVEPKFGPSVTGPLQMSSLLGQQR